MALRGRNPASRGRWSWRIRRRRFLRAPASGRMEIEIGKDRRVIVDAGVDVAALARVLAILARR